MAEEKPHSVTLALGSNREQERSLSAACARLAAFVAVEGASRRMWTTPIGPSPDLYMNMMLKGRTSLPLAELRRELKAVERQCGRGGADEQAGEVTVDIDIMEYDGGRERPGDWERGYIKELSKEI